MQKLSESVRFKMEALGSMEDGRAQSYQTCFEDELYTTHFFKRTDHAEKKGR
jgi:hypothetical protein